MAKTKEHYEEKLNDALDMEIEWSRLKKEDLKKLDGWFEELFEYISQVEEEQEEAKQSRPIDTLLDAAEVWIKTSEGPFAKTLRSIGKDIAEGEE